MTRSEKAISANVLLIQPMKKVCAVDLITLQKSNSKFCYPVLFVNIIT